MAADTKIVIVAGQEFSVPANTDVEQIRQQLTAMGFADVAAATVQKGTRKVGEVTYETVEFVKKAGTKGAELGGAELAALLASVPQAPGLHARRDASRDMREALRRLADETLTIGEALAAGDDLGRALMAIGHEGCRTTEGETLCASCDQIDAVAAPVPCAW